MTKWKSAGWKIYTYTGAHINVRFEATTKLTSTNEIVSCAWLSLKNDLNLVAEESDSKNMNTRVIWNKCECM